MEEHLDRLQSSLRTLGLPPCQEQEVRNSLKESARGILEGYVRIGIWLRLEEAAPLVISESRRTEKSRTIIHMNPQIPYSREQIRKGISVTTVPTRMAPVEAIQSRVKSSERLSSVLARLESPESVEVLRIEPQGFLTEGTISNLFFVKGKAVVTPPAWLGVLEGVTRTHVIEAARRLKILVQEIPVTRHDLFNADEAFLTNVLMGILPIRQVDGRTIGTRVPGPITRRLMYEITERDR